jgi:glutamate/tyrosine decarboxylase-like PLP-dependent enzyme
MDPVGDKEKEISLDPDDWQALRRLGHRMIDDLLTYLQTVRERPVWQPLPDAVRSFLKQPLPEQGQSEEDVYQQFCEHILPHPMGNIHPRFWGWVIGTGTPFGMLAEMLAAGMNPNLGGADHVANEVEAQVLDWLKQMLAYPADASGLLVSGCSMANLVGLAVARNQKAPIDLRRQGMRALPAPMLLYGSSEMHSSIRKAVELMGLGAEGLRQIPTDQHYRIDIAALRKQLAADKAKGFQPFCIVANAGTVNTGAFDDIEQLAAICARENLWLHVDGAFGALAALSPSHRGLVAGMQRADSLAFDLHKWMYMPLEIACILVRSEAAHRQTFALSTDYLKHGGDRGLIAGNKWFSEYGLQLSRGFRALKAWMSLKTYGVARYRRLIAQNVSQARYLKALIEAEPELECMAPVSLNIVCFRYCDNRLATEQLNGLNQELLVRLHESGLAAPSYTTLKGQYVLRVAITNHRSRRVDFDILVREVLRLGRELRTHIRCEPRAAVSDKRHCWFGAPQAGR